MLPQLGKILILFGAVIAVIGLLLLFADRVPFLGKLPGDLIFRRGGTTIFVPLMTMLVISVLLTIILNLFGRGR
jgi:hypothetical protein